MRFANGFSIGRPFLLNRWTTDGAKLIPLSKAAPHSAALWIDLCRPGPIEEQEMQTLLPKIPDQGEMRDLELSHRYYRLGEALYMTLVLPGTDHAGQSGHTGQLSRPVSFILTPERLITLRHHDPAAVLNLPLRTDLRLLPDRPDLLFLTFCEEIIGQMADLLEQTGDDLAMAAQQIYAQDSRTIPAHLHEALRRIGRKNETLAQVRAALMTLTRALRFFMSDLEDQGVVPPETRRSHEALLRDIDALDLHTDSLDARLGVLTEMTIGLIGLGDNKVAKAQSMVAALFLPPTLIASIYGMNFEHLPGLSHPHGFWLSIGAMFLASIGTWIFFRWRGWF